MNTHSGARPSRSAQLRNRSKEKTEMPGIHGSKKAIKRSEANASKLRKAKEVRKVRRDRKNKIKR
jgi:hypothetical protein